MNVVALCALLPIIIGNAALYRYHKARIPAEGLRGRREYPVSLPTRLFRHLVMPLYGLYALHLVLSAFWFDPRGPSLPALLAGVALGLASLVLLHRSFVALGPHFAPCHLGRLPRERIHRGPYRYLQHPMYCANMLMVAGLAIASFAPTIAGIGLALGVFYAFCIRDEDRALRDVPDAGR